MLHTCPPLTGLRLGLHAIDHRTPARKLPRTTVPIQSLHPPETRGWDVGPWLRPVSVRSRPLAKINMRSYQTTLGGCAFQDLCPSPAVLCPWLCLTLQPFGKMLTPCRYESLLAIQATLLFTGWPLDPTWTSSSLVCTDPKNTFRYTPRTKNDQEVRLLLEPTCRLALASLQFRFIWALGPRCSRPWEQGLSVGAHSLGSRPSGR